MRTTNPGGTIDGSLEPHVALPMVLYVTFGDVRCRRPAHLRHGRPQMGYGDASDAHRCRHGSATISPLHGALLEHVLVGSHGGGNVRRYRQGNMMMW